MKRFNILLATAVTLLSGCMKDVSVKVYNPLDRQREGEIVEIPLSSLSEHGFGDCGDFVVRDKVTGEEVASQITHDGLLIFPATVPAGGNSIYVISEGRAAEYGTRAYGRFAPERMDDLCWENDLISFRAYGPALEAAGELSCGYDVWVKRTDEMIVDRRYDLAFCDESMRKKAELKASGDEQALKEFEHSISLHVDHGDGCDYYAVGRTLGCGAMAPYTEGRLWMANNYTSYEILDNGPLRFTCKLTYAPFEADGRMVAEQRLISLDAGTHFNHATVTYTEADGTAADVRVAAGIVLHGTDDYQMKPEEGYICYADPVSTTDGQTYLGVIFTEGSWTAKTDCNHVLAITGHKSEDGVSYFFGAGWSKYGFGTPQDWEDYMKRQAEQLRSPLEVVIR